MLQKLVATGLLLAPAAADAQQLQSPPSSPTPAVTVATPSLPLPPEGCAWAGLAYSNGAQFCVAPGQLVVCNAGRWASTGGNIICSGAYPTAAPQ